MAKASSPEKKFLITAEGLRKLEDELQNLKTVKRKEIADKLAEAISFGDLSENAEYDAAKNEQAFTEQRINEIEDKIKYAEIISDTTGEAGTVKIGSKVKLQFADTDDLHEYSIVGSTESNPLEGFISNESPLGEAILGKKAKDIVKVQAPGGEFAYTILAVS